MQKNRCDILYHSVEKKMLNSGPKTELEGGSPP